MATADGGRPDAGQPGGADLSAGQESWRQDDWAQQDWATQDVSQAEDKPDLGLGHRSNPQARMPLLEHLRELRNRVVKAAIAVTIGSVAGWFVFPWVWDFIKGPYCKAQAAGADKGSAAVQAALAHTAGTLAPHCQLYYGSVFAPIVLRLQISIACGVVLASPILLYQIWAFIAPGLYRRERRWAYYFAGSAVPLFAVGGTIAYFAMTRGLQFLLHMAPADSAALIQINTYLNYAGSMLLIFGLAFEMPLVFVLLNLAGVLTHARFRKWRRVIIFLVFAFAAVFTPSPDPLSVLMLAVPCVLLVEAAEVFAWANDRRRARNGSLAFPGLTEEQVKEFGLDQPAGEQTTAAR